MVPFPPDPRNSGQARPHCFSKGSLGISVRFPRSDQFTGVNELSDATLPQRSAVRAEGGILGDLQRWFLLAVLAVGAMMPWYTLRLFPVLTLGSAKINPLDGLVACAVLLGAPAVVRGFWRGDREGLWVLAFLLSMLVPLLIGLLDSQSVFYAVRESRALAFYALALAFAAGGYGSRDFYTFAAAYVAGTVIAIVAVFSHVHWHVPLPGFPDALLVPSGLAYRGVVRYLDWTVPSIAFMLSLAGTLAAPSLRARLAWGASLPCLVWYLIAMHERTTQGIGMVAAIVLIGIPGTGGLKFHRVAFLGATLAVIIALGLGVVAGPRWVSGPAQIMLWHWSHAVDDDSLRQRIRELRAGFPRFERHPLSGEGLGAIVSDKPPDGRPGGPWRYIASGYGFLLVKTGLVGFGLYVAMIGIALRRAWHRLRHERGGGAWPLATIGVAGLGVLLALNLVHPVVDIPEGAIAFSLFFGMLVSREEPMPT